MLSRTQCPQTGVINLFLDEDPLAAGSVSASGRRHFVWRCYITDNANGLTSDVALAEAYLRVAIANQRRSQDAASCPTINDQLH